MNVVPRTGFEPVISALRGRCPRPLDDRGKPCYLLPGEDSNLGPPEPESGVLPTELPGKWGQSSKGRWPPRPFIIARPVIRLSVVGRPQGQAQLGTLTSTRSGVAVQWRA